MRAYHNDPKLKTDILAQLQAHRQADEIVQGQYWKNGKGCAVGCTIHSGNHMEYETRFGIPVMLARLEDTIFEGLPNGTAQDWPIRFMTAIPAGADLSRVGWKFLHWLLTDVEVNPGIHDPLVKDAVAACAAVLVPLTEGRPVDREAAREAESAAWAAAQEAAEAAWAAAWAAAESAAARAAAESAAWAAAARSAAARSAAARSAAARSAAAYKRMADKLIELIEEGAP